MSTALLSFADRADARRLAAQLADAGFESGAVEVHVRDDDPNAAIVGQLDEQLTGGFVHSFSDLWRGIFEGSPSAELATERASYEEGLGRGGAVLSVYAATDDEQARADAVIGPAPASRRSAWLP